MTGPRSLGARLALTLALMVTVLWLAAAAVTSRLLNDEMDEVFDSALQETAQRILQLAVIDILSREEQGVAQKVTALHEHGEFFTYVVRDGQGRILLQSHAADPATFPPYDGPGFRQTATHRLFHEAAVRDTITISVAEPLAHRAEIAGEVRLGLALPLALIIPLSLLGILAALRVSLRPLRRLKDQVARRGANDLDPVDMAGLPDELVPVTGAMNQLFLRLRSAFDAERAFAANAAHELRTPLAGAIAQAQRLRQETGDPDAARRAQDIEMTLKRLTRRTERLLQLARAEGSRLRSDTVADLRPVVRLVTDDLIRGPEGAPLHVTLPEGPVLSDMDLDAFGIVCRNLVENALRHGTAGTVIRVSLAADGRFCVENDCDPVAASVLETLTDRFARGARATDGSGLGLAIVRTIAERSGAALDLQSPAPGRQDGFRACLSVNQPSSGPAGKVGRGQADAQPSD